jgi:uncharacterized membrane-anchored protein YitT (DUF2179 family)
MKVLAGWRGWPVLKNISWNLGLLLTGSLLCAAAVIGILIRQHFFSGGVAGLAIMIHYLIPFFSVAFLYALANVPLFLTGWFVIGRRFFLYSVVGTLLLIAAIALVDVDIPVHDKLLAALLAGLIQGVGSGIILKSLGSSGGTDILAVIFFQRFSVQLGTTKLIFNLMILVAAALLFSLEDALYTLIYLYSATRIIDLVVTGLNQRKAFFIISPLGETISRRILNEINRGVTILHGKGAYSEQKQQILYTVINLREMAPLKEIVRNVDPDAVVVVSDTTEVMGRRIGNQLRW